MENLNKKYLKEIFCGSIYDFTDESAINWL